MIVITVARKPLEGTVANNVLKHGAGGIHIDATRIGHTEDFSGIKSRAAMKLNTGGKTHDPNCDSVKEAQAKLQSLGRWPPNMILSHMSGCRETVPVWVCAEGCPVAALDGHGASRFFKQIQGKV